MTGEQVTAGIFLRRLERLFRLRDVYRHELNAQAWRLLTRSITATYGDCLDYGVDCEADAIMSKAQS